MIIEERGDHTRIIVLLTPIIEVYGCEILLEGTVDEAVEGFATVAGPPFHKKPCFHSD